ncbi:MAG: glycosyltransferase family 2 protein, partial [Actinomycetota bacterium]|nr:glycosyltransferase family 2 protein [Actinomycetota bacterium]
MKLVMTLLARDEADIVDANVAYHLSQGVDFVIATDHSSRDGTADLLRRYEREGVLLLREAGGEAHDQVAHVNAMARTAALDYGADWVINNDADEFWWPLVGSLKDVVSAVPDGIGALVASRSNFLPSVSGPEAFLERMVVREVASKNARGDPLEPKVIHRATPEIEMAPGNHSIDAPDMAVAPDLGLLEVLHFPMRTFEQFERKVVNVGVGYERLEGRAPEVGRDQLALLALQREGRLREHFDDLTVGGDGLDAALASGSLVVDTRLRDYMAAHDSRRHEMPDAIARQTVSSALGVAAKLPQVSADLERRSAELAQARAELDQARADLALRDQELDAARAERESLERRLAATDETLRTLQSSRLMRYS